MKFRITIDVDGNQHSVYTDIPVHDLEFLTLLLDAVLHVAAKIARNHNCADLLCEVQPFAQKVVFTISKGLEKEMSYAKKRQDSRGSNGGNEEKGLTFGREKGTNPPQPENH